MTALRILRRSFLALAALSVLCAGPSAWAQPARESTVKAAFLFKFGAFVEWPAGTFSRPDQPLVIGVAGDDDVAADLEQLVVGRNMEGRPVAVRRLPDAAQSAGIHVLFIGNRREARLREAIEAVSGPVLIVTDQAGALRLGSVLNFTTEAGRVRFSASLASAEAHNLKLSARLLAVAHSVERTR